MGPWASKPRAGDKHASMRFLSHPAGRLLTAPLNGCRSHEKSAGHMLDKVGPVARFRTALALCYVEC